MCIVFEMCVCAVFLQCLWRAEDVVRSSGTRVTHDGEPPCRYWDSNPSPLGQPLVLLRISTAPQSMLLMTMCSSLQRQSQVPPTQHSPMNQGKLRRWSWPSSSHQQHSADLNNRLRSSRALREEPRGLSLSGCCGHK